MKKIVLSLALLAFIPMTHAGLKTAYCTNGTDILKTTDAGIAQVKEQLPDISGVKLCDKTFNGGVQDTKLLCFNATTTGFLGGEWADSPDRQGEICQELSKTASNTDFSGGLFDLPARGGL